MIIDFHTHTFPDALAGKVIPMLAGTANIINYTDGTNSGLLDSMKTAGIDLSVILPVVTKPSQVGTINDTAKRINENYTSLLSFGGLHPENEDYREILKDLAASDIRGIKLHPLYQDADIDDIRYLRIIDCACELGLIVVIHAGRDLSFPGDHATPKMIRHMLDEIHPDRMVLAHMGSYAYWEEVDELLCGQGAYLDTSFSVIPIRSGEKTGASANPNLVPSLSRQLFNRLVKHNGADRILFASDSPWGDQKETLDIVCSYLDDKDKNAVLGENALRLLGSAGYLTE